MSFACMILKPSVGEPQPRERLELWRNVSTRFFPWVGFARWRRFRLALAAGDAAEAGRRLGQIRTIVLVNLTLGLITVAVAAGGRWWG